MFPSGFFMVHYATTSSKDEVSGIKQNNYKNMAINNHLLQ